MPENPSTNFPELGKEYPIPNEAYFISKIVERFKKVLSKQYPPGKTRRMFHPKIHGLVKAEFTVESNLDEVYKVGIFKTVKTYKTWIRFSNAKRKPSPDKKKDMRGMAIKLMGVEGRQLLEAHQTSQTQDFLLITAPILPTETVKDFQKAVYALTGGFFALFLYAITHIGTIIRSVKMVGNSSNVLNHQYFSTVPSKFGTGNRAVKYAVIPQKILETKQQDPSNFNYLKTQLKKDLSSGFVQLDFMVQFQKDPVKQPIEDPRVVWTTPYVKLATIRILKQTFDTEEQRKYAENLSFTPWHGIEAHQPLGGPNRARKSVYEELSAFRHKRNKTPEKEPADWEVFEVGLPL